MKTKVDVSSTVLRALKVLDHLKALPGPQSVSLISKELSLSPTIVHRLLTTLKMEGFVFQDPQTKRYSIGSIFLEYANQYLLELPIASIIEPWLLELRNITGETAGFYIPNGHNRLCVREYESRQEIKYSVGTGNRKSICAGATGIAILAFQSNQYQQQIFDKLNEDVKEIVYKKMKHTLKLGYAVSMNERTNHVSAVSAPVLDQHHRVVGAITVSGPSFRFSEDKITACTGELLRATKIITESFDK